MNFVSIEAPTARVATTGELSELLDTSLRIIVARQLSQVLCSVFSCSADEITVSAPCERVDLEALEATKGPEVR